MKLKRLLIFIITCLSLQGFSQTKQTKSFELNWNLSAQLALPNDKSNLYPLVQNNYIDAKGLPAFDVQWEVAEKSNVVDFRLKNLRYESIDIGKYTSLAGLEIPVELSPNFVISKGGEHYYALLSLTPLVRSANKVMRLVSFELEYELGSRRSRRSATLVEDSVLANGTWYKFAVDRTGIFKLNSSFLQQLGIDVSSLDPRNIRIYGNGGAMLPQLNSSFRHENLQENSVYVSGEQDGVFNSNDFVLFYAVGPDDWETSSESNITHRKNRYSDHAFYFISVDNGIGKRISSASVLETDATDQISSFKDFVFYEKDLTNLFGSGQEWFGDSFQIKNTRNYSIDFQNLDTSSEVLFRIRAVSESSSTSLMNVQIDGLSSFDINFAAINGNSYVRASATTKEFSTNLIDGDIDLAISYNNNGNPSADAHLDYIEVIGDKLLIANGDQFSFRNYLSKTSGKVLEYEIANVENIDRVWDVTDFLNPKKITNQSESNDGFRFKANSGVLNEYVLASSSDYYEPTLLDNSIVENQNLHGLKDIQYLLITKKEFISQAQRLAAHHNANSGLSTQVVDLEQVYNEFGSGSKDITAIRDFVKFLYDNASTPEAKIKYLCLLGDATYDYKDTGRTPNNNNIVPNYQAPESFSLVYSYATDDFYGMMDANEGNLNSTDRQDVATGRILASNLQELTNGIDKILNYHSTASLGAWRNQLTLMADDLKTRSESVLQGDMEYIADLIKVNKPQYNIKKLYADSFVQQSSSGGDRYPELNIALSDIVEKGSLLIDYFGHGGELGLGHERFLEVSEIREWSNFNKLPLFITVTCDFTRFDNPSRITAGEEMLLDANGGAASLISTTREIFINYGRSFNRDLISNLLDYNSDDYTIAEALMATKNSKPSIGGQHYFIYSFGDPAMKLGRPLPNIQLTKINDKDVSVYRDTLKALSKIKLEGVVSSLTGEVLSDFEGTLTASIFDKEIVKTTLDNDDFGVTMNFDVQESKIFNGKSAVNNGVFSLEFVVPKDIKLSYGTSKISLYAEDQSNSKGGFDLETIIGGIDENAESDTLGPEILLFLNDDSFVNGGNTNVSPNLIVQLSDNNGINTSLGAIGHSIVAILDADDSNPIQLNEYYESDLGDFTKGRLNYKLRELTPGAHVLKVKAWDTHNNSSEETLEFTVIDENSFLLENVLNYPNPFINYTEFWFNHNKPNTSLDVNVFIFTVNGKLVKSISQTVQTSGGLSRSISWDGKDDYGQKVGKGVYVYKLEVTDSGTGVAAEKYEKLVLLQ